MCRTIAVDLPPQLPTDPHRRVSSPALADALTVKHRRVPSRPDGDMIRLLRNPRLWIWLVVVPAIVSGMLFAYPGGPLMAFQDVTDSGKFRDAIRASEGDGERMHNEMVCLHDRLQHKEELLEAWMDRRLTFRAVCESFARINANYPSTLCIHRDMYGADVGELELGAMNVVAYLEQRCESYESPYRLKQRIKEDYAATFGHRPLRMR